MGRSIPRACLASLVSALALAMASAAEVGFTQDPAPSATGGT